MSSIASASSIGRVASSFTAVTLGHALTTNGGIILWPSPLQLPPILTREHTFGSRPSCNHPCCQPRVDMHASSTPGVCPQLRGIHGLHLTLSLQGHLEEATLPSRPYHRVPSNPRLTPRYVVPHPNHSPFAPTPNLPKAKYNLYSRSRPPSATSSRVCARACRRLLARCMTRTGCQSGAARDAVRAKSLSLAMAVLCAGAFRRRTRCGSEGTC
jgi:hypothetical protein